MFIIIIISSSSVSVSGSGSVSSSFIISRTEMDSDTIRTVRTSIREGTNGVSTNGVTAISMFFDRGIC